MTTLSVESSVQSSVPALVKDDASVSSSSESSVPSQSSSNNGGDQKMRDLTMLPKDFEPVETDVVIGRGKLARTHDGNQRLKMLIEFMIPEYSAAGNNKDEKSYIIKEIVTQIRKSSPDGGFVKFDKSKGRWFEVGDFLAREKISQTFRDAMGEAYSSSNPYKRKRRSFEKQHSAILDIIKNQRGSSPTSVVAPGGVASPNSPPSPEPMTVMMDQRRVLDGSSAFQQQQEQQQQRSSLMMDMFHKRPGQIGFARNSMFQYGASNSTIFQGRASDTQMLSHPMAPLASAAMGVDVRRPTPYFAPSGGMNMPTRDELQQQRARRVSLEMEHAARRTSMPSSTSSAALAAYSPALMTDIFKRQRIAHNAAMLRRASGF